MCGSPGPLAHLHHHKVGHEPAEDQRSHSCHRARDDILGGQGLGLGY